MKFCWSGDQEYMIGTRATVFRVRMNKVWVLKVGKLLSTVHWRRTKACPVRSSNIQVTPLKSLCAEYIFIHSWY